MLNKIIYPVIIVLFFIAGFFINNDIDVITDSKPTTAINISFSHCNVQKETCNVDTDDFSLNISFDEHVYYLKPFNFSISSKLKSNVEIESVQIDFKMKNMDMGVNRFMLKNINIKNKFQTWKGKALLPICVTGRADWISELEVITEDTKYIISFPISVKKAIN